MSSSAVHRRVWLRRSAAVVAGCALLAVLLALAEVGLRLASGPERFYPHVANTVLRWGPSSSAITPGIEGCAYISTNRWGCRGPELGEQRRRLLVVGGSTALCIALDDGEAWPALLMRDVNARLGDGDALWVTNAGMEGRDSHHHLVHAELLVPELPALDHVLLYCGLNDVVKWMRQAASPNPAPSVSRAELIARSFALSDHHPSGTPWYRRLELAKLWHGLAAAVRRRRYASRSQDAVAGDADFSRDYRAFLDAQQEHLAEVGIRRLDGAQMATLATAVAAYEDRLRALVDAVREHGAEPLLMAQFVRLRRLSERERYFAWWKELVPQGPFADPEQMQDIVETYNQAMQRVAVERGVLFIDLPELLRGDAAGGEFGGLFHDGVHYSERGARLVAERVADRLVETVYRD